MRRRLATVLVAAVAVTAACGGSGGPSKAAFVEQANQLCRTLTDHYTTGKLKLPTPPSAADIKDYVQGSYAPQAISTYQQIGALGLPQSEADDLKSLLTAAIAQVKLIQADPATFGVPQTQRELVHRFESAGLTECGAGFQHDLDKPQFIKEANDVCNGLAAKVQSTTRSLGVQTTSPPEVIASYVKGTLAPLYRDAISQVNALGFPAGDEDLLRTLLQDWRADIDSLDQNPALYNEVRPAVGDVSARWIEYGAESCRARGAGFQLAVDVPQPVIDKAQFVKETNGICSSLAAKVQSTTRSFGIETTSSPEAIASFVKDTLAPLYRDALSQVEALGFPVGDEDLLRKLLQDWRADVDSVDQNPALYSAVRPAVLDVIARWVQYGATSCGVGG